MSSIEKTKNEVNESKGSYWDTESLYPSENTFKDEVKTIYPLIVDDSKDQRERHLHFYSTFGKLPTLDTIKTAVDFLEKFEKIVLKWRDIVTDPKSKWLLEWKKKGCICEQGYYQAFIPGYCNGILNTTRQISNSSSGLPVILNSGFPDDCEDLIYHLRELASPHNKQEVEVNNLPGDDSDFHHGYNSGVLASSRLFLGLLSDCQPLRQMAINDFYDVQSP